MPGERFSGAALDYVFVENLIYAIIIKLVSGYRILRQLQAVIDLWNRQWKKKLRTRAATQQRPTGIAYIIGRLEHALRRHLRDCLAPIGLTVSQYTALSFLDASGQISNAQLAERSLISPQSSNEMVKMMEGKGWIERQPDQSHGRIVQIQVTPLGKGVLRQCNAAVVRLEESMMSGLSDEECAEIQGRLRTLLHVLSAMMVDASPY